MTIHPTLDQATKQACGKCGTPSRCHCCETPETCGLECLERPLFTAGMALSDTDLTALTDWAGSRLGLHRHRDGWGVVCGLDVHCDPDRPGSVVVEPGYAVGCCGEDVVLCDPQTVDLTGCCSTDSPCGEPVKDPKNLKASKDSDPCGDVVVDVVLSPLASPAVPELIDTCSCGCGREAQVVPTRMRESGLVESVRVAFPADETNEAAAERAQATYRDCHGIVRNWVDAGDTSKWTRADVVGWLGQQKVDPPCDWWDTTCAELETPEAAHVDEVMTRALLDLVVACRHSLLRRPCSTCESSRIGLARVWLRRVEKDPGTTCVVTRVDAYRPHRREQRHDLRPVPAGAEDLAPFIWQRWDEVCPRWRQLAPTTEPLVVDLPTTSKELLSMLDRADRLWWACGERAPQPIVIHTRCLGDRVLGFGERKRIPEDVGTLEDVRGIGHTYSQILADQGTSTVEELARLEPRVISQTLGVGEKVGEAIWLDAVERLKGTT